MSAPGLLDHHQALLDARAISPAVAADRGYSSTMLPAWLRQQGFSIAVSDLIPGLVIPVYDVHGGLAFHQYRPDKPRTRNGKPVKYETPAKTRMVLDVPRSINGKLVDPAVPLFITEGPLKADAAVSAGLACIATFGVYGWRGTNRRGGKTVLPDFESVALNGRTVYLVPDSDVATNPVVANAVSREGAMLTSRGADVRYVYLPRPADGRKVGLDDYLANGGTADGLYALADDEPPERPAPTPSPPPPAPPPAAPRTLAETHATFNKWMGDDYDLDVLDIVLATAAAEQLDGDPPWLLVVSGSGAAKTETVIPLAAAGGLITSTIASEGALLSATSTRERTKDATGGLLLKIGARGLLIIKDVTSVISMDRHARGQVLAALREVYDGKWERNVGTDGGRSLTWTGRLVVIGAVTTAWDSAHAVVAAMGDRFLLVRLDSKTGRDRAGRQAIHNAGGETVMRAELATAAGGVLATVDTAQDFTLADDEVETLLGLADVVTLTRTGVELDYRGDVVDAHAPEMPTRFAKQLTMVVRGALSLGMTRHRAFTLATRCARDSMPPLRLAALLDVHTNPRSTTHAVRTRLDRPRTTVDRTLQALHVLGLVTVEEVEEPHGASFRTVWWYSLSDAVNADALTLMGSTGNVTTPNHEPREEASDKQRTDVRTHAPTHISGTTPEPPPAAGCAECQRRSAFVGSGPCPQHQPGRATL